MNTEKKFGFATRQIHAGHMENAAGSLCAPIYQTSTFAFSTVQQGGARFAGEEGGYIYTRLGNPTLGAVEEKLASLEGGEAAMAAASGVRWKRWTRGPQKQKIRMLSAPMAT